MRSAFSDAMVAILLVGCACSEALPQADTALQKPESPVASYVNRNLRKLEEAPRTKLAELLNPILPKKYRSDELWAFEPWSIWRSDSAKGKNGFILFQGRRMAFVPGQSYAAVHFLDDSGKLLSSVDFSTGWRIDIDDANLRFEPTVKGHVIDVRSSRTINGRDVCRQVYGINQGRVALLWLEDSGGKMMSNIYRSPNHTIGPDVPKRTAEEWEQALASAEPMVVLEALTWLGGEHREDLSAKPQNFVIEDVETAKLFAAVRQRPGVRKALDGLSRSKNQWIQQAAKLTLEMGK
jgi:hypothetical protein